MKKLSQILTVLFAVLISTPVFAAVSPVGLAIVPPVQFPPDDFNIAGARLSLGFGDHRSVYGLDIGVLGNITRQEFAGIGISGLFNITHGETTVVGLQLAGLANMNYQKTNVVGLQLAILANYNEAESSLGGLQVALANISEFTTIRGIQLGAYNVAKEVYGFQIGLVNVATNLHGLQIGIINFHHQGLFAVSPILNVGF